MKVLLIFVALGWLPVTAVAEWKKATYQPAEHTTSYINTTDVTVRNGWHYYYELEDIHDGWKIEGKTYFSVEYYFKYDCNSTMREMLSLTIFSKPWAEGISKELPRVKGQFAQEEFEKPEFVEICKN